MYLDLITITIYNNISRTNLRITFLIFIFLIFETHYSNDIISSLITHKNHEINHNIFTFFNSINYKKNQILI